MTRDTTCFVCGDRIRKSAKSSGEPVFYGELQLIEVHRPYAYDSKQTKVNVCQNCMRKKIGMDSKGDNLNILEDRHDPKCPKCGVKLNWSGRTDIYSVWTHPDTPDCKVRGDFHRHFTPPDHKHDGNTHV
jgi:hypothetical protein